MACYDRSDSQAFGERLPAATERLVQADHRLRDGRRAVDPLLFAGQQRRLHREHVEKVHRAFHVLLLSGVQGDAVFAHGLGQVIAPQLAGVVQAQHIVDFVPGAEHHLAVVQRGLLLLRFTQLQRALEPATFKDRQRQLRAKSKPS